MLKKILREFRQIWSWYGVPFVATPDDKLKIILENLELQEWETFVDIGCGDGKILEVVSRKFPTVMCIGYESSSYPYSLALERKRESQYDFEIHKKNVFSVSLADVDIIHIYMVPYMLPKLIKKIQSECRIGTKIYIQSHEVKNWIPERVVPLSKKNNLYIYTLK